MNVLRIVPAEVMEPHYDLAVNDPTSRDILSLTLSPEMRRRITVMRRM